MVDLLDDKWEAVIHGCNHKQVMTSKEISQATEICFDPATGRMEKFLCVQRLCRRKTGFCVDSVLQKIAMAKKLTRLDNKIIKRVRCLS